MNATTAPIPGFATALDPNVHPPVNIGPSERTLSPAAERASEGPVDPIRTLPAPEMDPANGLAPVIAMPVRHRPGSGRIAGADSRGGPRDASIIALRRPHDSEEETKLVHAMAAKIGQAAIEVLAGTRPAQQLARWLDPRSFDALQVRAALTRAAQAAARQGNARQGNVRQLHRNPMVRSVHCCRVSPGIYESSLVVSEQQRARAVAMRLEKTSGIWKVTALIIG